MSKITVRRSGTLKIVSSGYTDRYVMSDTYVELTTDGIKFRVNKDDAVLAYLRLSGMEATQENLLLAVQAIEHAERKTWINAEIIPTDEERARGIGRQIKAFPTLAYRIEAGINVCTGYRSLNAKGREEANKIAAELTPDEWAAVYSGLDAVNREHARLGLPIVEFSREN